MMKKTDYPVIVLRELIFLKKHIKSLEGVVLKEGENDSIFLIEDPYGEQGFFFKVNKARLKEKLVVYEIELCPPSEYSLKSNIIDGYLYNNVVDVIKTWIEHVKFISKADLFKDTILDKYEAKFYEEFELIDEDADESSFSIEQQVAIDVYLDKAIKLLEHKIVNNEVTEKHIHKVEEIVEDLKELQEDQTELTKKQVVKKLSNIWAKCQKIGIKLFKDVYNEALKEVIKLGVKFISENSSSISDGLSEVIS